MKNNYYPIPYKTENLCNLFDVSTKKYSKKIAIQFYEDKNISKVTYKTLRKDVEDVSNYLINLKYTDCNILIIGDLSYNWIVLYFATLMVNSTVVSIDKTLVGTNYFNHISETIDIRCVICENEKVDSIYFQCKTFSYSEIFTSLSENAFSITRIIKMNDNKLRKYANVLFTSGTTGEMKPVYLTHENMAYNVMGSQMLLGRTSKDNLLSFLPVNHAFELTTGVLTPLFVGATICISRGLRYAIKDMKEFSPTIMPLVPLIAKTIMKNINLEIQRQNKVDKVSRLLALSRKSSFFRIFIRKILFRNIVSGLGKKLKTFVCGGAYLEENLQRQFLEYGFTFLNGYGITECSPVASCSYDKEIIIGSVGRKMPFCEVKIIENEIATRGKIVAKKEASINNHMHFIEDWFLTGDIGYIDKNDNIFITGRKKNLIILDNGENISPEILEKHLSGIDGVQEVIVGTIKLNSNQSVLGAIISPIPALQFNNGVSAQEYYQQEINKLNLPYKSRIQKIIIYDGLFPVTVSGKIARDKVFTSIESEGFQNE